MSDIFISYAKADVQRVEPLAHALETEGWSVWWDPLITPGLQFDQIITEALGSARCVIVVWSKKSVGSHWVRDEAGEGAERQILLPLMIEDVQIPLGFRSFQAVNLINWQGELQDPNFNKLRHALVALLGASPPPHKPDVPGQPEVPNPIIVSPIVGIFYRAPSPAAEPFVRVGDHVQPDTVVCIIEAMKLMNEIRAKTSGKIFKVFVENGQPVEYGQPLFEVGDSPQPAKAEPKREETQIHAIKAPNIGTFHGAPSFGSDPFVRVGDHVQPDTVVGIIETMGVMQEIQAGTSGKVVHIYAGHGQFVESDDTLLEIGEPPAKAEPELPKAQLHIITAPIVGSFYLMPSRASEPFVKVGDQVKPDTVVCIIEAMKLMNEIQAETSGIIVKIFVENGRAVEYGEPLFGVISVD